MAVFNRKKLAFCVLSALICAFLWGCGSPVRETTELHISTAEPDRLVIYLGTQSIVAYEINGLDWIPIRTMACSTGKISATGNRTPAGVYRLGQKYEYKVLDGSYGQYASRITDGYLFHSVPIDENAVTQEMGKRNMSLLSYTMLGSLASHGCVRLCVADAKWIYDHCDSNTDVMVLNADGPTPPELPALIMEEPYITGENRGWDPTDPDPENPYLSVYGPYLSPEEKILAQAAGAADANAAGGDPSVPTPDAGQTATPVVGGSTETGSGDTVADATDDTGTAADANATGNAAGGDPSVPTPDAVQTATLAGNGKNA